jgi:hypothetical protein
MPSKPINGHSSFSKLFPLDAAEGELINQRGLFSLSTTEINEVNDQLTTYENRQTAHTGSGTSPTGTTQALTHL